VEVFQGKSIFKGVAIGPLLYYGKKETTVRREKIEDTEAEVARYKRPAKNPSPSSGSCMMIL
jgi:phosphotransferase system enzyme I (PtsI)